jgi:hypothetical protein
VNTRGAKKTSLMYGEARRHQTVSYETHLVTIYEYLQRYSTMVYWAILHDCDPFQVKFILLPHMLLKPNTNSMWTTFITINNEIRSEIHIFYTRVFDFIWFDFPASDVDLLQIRTVITNPIVPKYRNLVPPWRNRLTGLFPFRINYEIMNFTDGW